MFDEFCTICSILHFLNARKMKFSIKDFSVNVTNSAVVTVILNGKLPGDSGLLSYIHFIKVIGDYNSPIPCLLNE